MRPENNNANVGEPPIPADIDIMDGTKRSVRGFICPQCGNQVSPYVHKKFCPHCRQRLFWPGRTPNTNHEGREPREADQEA